MSKRAPPDLRTLLGQEVKLDEVVYPSRFQYDNLIINILEITEVPVPNGKEFFVVVQISDGKHTTRPFTIPCKNTHDFVQKLRIECMKFRFTKRVIPPAHFDKIIR